MLTTSIRPSATQDIIRHAIHIAADHPDAAERFILAATSAFELITQMPRAGSAKQIRNQNLTGLRQWPIKGFERYVIFYLPTPEGIDIVRVLHSAQDIDPILQLE